MRATDRLRGMVSACRRDMQTVELYYINRWTVREIATINGVNKKSIDIRLKRGLGRLGYIAPGTIKQIKEARQELRKRREELKEQRPYED